VDQAIRVLRRKKDSSNEFYSSSALLKNAYMGKDADSVSIDPRRLILRSTDELPYQLEQLYVHASIAAVNALVNSMNRNDTTSSPVDSAKNGKLLNLNADRLIVIGDLHTDDRALAAIKTVIEHDLSEVGTHAVLVGDIFKTINLKDYEGLLQRFKYPALLSLEGYAMEENINARGGALFDMLYFLKAQYPSNFHVLVGNAELYFDYPGNDKLRASVGSDEKQQKARSLIEESPVFALVNLSGRKYLVSHAGYLPEKDEVSLHDLISFPIGSLFKGSNDSRQDNNYIHMARASLIGRFNQLKGEMGEAAAREQIGAIIAKVNSQLSVDAQITGHIHLFGRYNEQQQLALGYVSTEEGLILFKALGFDGRLVVINSYSPFGNYTYFDSKYDIQDDEIRLTPVRASSLSENLLLNFSTNTTARDVSDHLESMRVLAETEKAKVLLAAQALKTRLEMIVEGAKREHMPCVGCLKTGHCVELLQISLGSQETKQGCSGCASKGRSKILPDEAEDILASVNDLIVSLLVGEQGSSPAKEPYVFVYTEEDSAANTLMRSLKHLRIEKTFETFSYGEGVNLALRALYNLGEEGAEERLFNVIKDGNLGLLPQSVYELSSVSPKIRAMVYYEEKNRAPFILFNKEIIKDRVLIAAALVYAAIASQRLYQGNFSHNDIQYQAQSLADFVLNTFVYEAERAGNVHYASLSANVYRLNGEVSHSQVEPVNSGYTRHLMRSCPMGVVALDKYFWMTTDSAESLQAIDIDTYNSFWVAVLGKIVVSRMVRDRETRVMGERNTIGLLVASENRFGADITENQRVKMISKMINSLLFDLINVRGAQITKISYSLGFIKGDGSITVETQKIRRQEGNNVPVILKVLRQALAERPIFAGRSQYADVRVNPAGEADIAPFSSAWRAEDDFRRRIIESSKRISLDAASSAIPYGESAASEEVGLILRHRDVFKRADRLDHYYFPMVARFFEEQGLGVIFGIFRHGEYYRGPPELFAELNNIGLDKNALIWVDGRNAKWIILRHDLFEASKIVKHVARSIGILFGLAPNLADRLKRIGTSDFSGGDKERLKKFIGRIIAGSGNTASSSAISVLQHNLVGLETIRELIEEEDDEILRYGRFEAHLEHFGNTLGEFTGKALILVDVDDTGKIVQFCPYCEVYALTGRSKTFLGWSTVKNAESGNTHMLAFNGRHFGLIRFETHRVNRQISRAVKEANKRIDEGREISNMDDSSSPVSLSQPSYPDTALLVHTFADNNPSITRKLIATQVAVLEGIENRFLLVHGNYRLPVEFDSQARYKKIDFNHPGVFTNDGTYGRALFIKDTAVIIGGDFQACLLRAVFATARHQFSEGFSSFTAVLPAEAIWIVSGSSYRGETLRDVLKMVADGSAHPKFFKAAQNSTPEERISKFLTNVLFNLSGNLPKAHISANLNGAPINLGELSEKLHRGKLTKSINLEILSSSSPLETRSLLTAAVMFYALSGISLAQEFVVKQSHKNNNGAVEITYGVDYAGPSLKDEIIYAGKIKIYVIDSADGQDVHPVDLHVYSGLDNHVIGVLNLNAKNTKQLFTSKLFLSVTQIN
jgi:hypothetical protein